MNSYSMTDLLCQKVTGSPFFLDHGGHSLPGNASRLSDAYTIPIKFLAIIVFVDKGLELLRI